MRIRERESFFASRFHKDNKKSDFQTLFLKNLKLITNEKTITYHIQACLFCCILLFVSQEVSAQITFSVKNQTIRRRYE
jgi:hypothetical protein